MVRRMPGRSSCDSGALSPKGRVQGGADGGVGVGQGLKGLGGVDHPAAFGGQAFQAEALPMPDEHGGSGTVYFEDEPGTGHELSEFPF